ncbi:hypothetical protein [Pantanalinema sp. GBBB05]|uniref:hypothetical protein n=1 Tax=Pantanalinema sp. GBBB05 TaxID=2604139 RepID=UPI001D36D03B|nr:hypothetical protein [Pantanalinema sp. GBBB05]
MNTKPVIFLSGMLAMAIMGMPIAPAIAQDISVPAPESSQLPEPSRLNSGSLNLGAELQLNAAQRDAIEQLSELAIDQIEALVDSGFDPQKLDRSSITRKSADIQKLLTSLMPDAEQKLGLQKLLKGALQQMRQQLQTDLNR